MIIIIPVSRTCCYKTFKATSFPGSTPLSRWRPREDPGTHRYDTHVDWSEDMDILTLVVIGRKLSSLQNDRLVWLHLLFPLQWERNYRRLNIPRIVSTIHGN